MEKITWNTMLIQGKDGKLYYKDGDEIELASMTDILKHYQSIQHTLTTLTGAWATDRPDIVKKFVIDKLFNEIFWQIE